MMFITPTPPTISDTVATPDSSAVIVRVVRVRRVTNVVERANAEVVAHVGPNLMAVSEQAADVLGDHGDLFRLD
jgi:hypothetical protein